MLATNIILAAAIFVVVVGPLIWAIRTALRDERATAPLAEAASVATSRPAAHRLRPRTVATKLSSPREVARS